MPTLTNVGKLTPNPRVVSPGVFTSEIDQSGLAQGVANIGAVIVAPFAKGPGFTPTTFTDANVLQDTFGIPDGKYYGPYTATGYLQEHGSVTVCRVGALTGYQQKNPLLVYAVPGTWGRSSSIAPLVSLSNQASYCQLSNAEKSPLDFLTYSSNGSLTMSAQIVAIFSSDTSSYVPANSAVDYQGETVTIGTISYAWASGSFYITSSIQGDPFKTNTEKLAQAILESTTTTSSLSMSFSEVALTTSDEFDAAGVVKFQSASFATFRAASGCDNFLYVYGKVSGSFDRYTDTFTPDSAGATADPCLTASAGAGAPIVLAVLADTLNSAPNTNYEQSGFSGSSLTYYTSSNGYYVDNKEFSLVLKKEGSFVRNYKFSIDSERNNYIVDVFGTDATIGDPDDQAIGQPIDAAYLYKVFEDRIAMVSSNKKDYQIQVGTDLRIAEYSLSASVLSSSYRGDAIAMNGSLMKFKDDADIDNEDSAFALTNAYTPWIKSQNIGDENNPIRLDLFKVHTMTDGTVANKMYKIEISNVKLAGTVAGSDIGTFTLSVRDFDDTDKNPVYLEIYQNLNLNPDSADFVARRIGDRYNYINASGKIKEFGTYTNISRRVRIEMSGVNYPVSAVPYGFAAYSTPIDTNYGVFVPKMMYAKASTYSTSPGKYPSGIAFGVPVGADATLRSLYPTCSLNVGVDNDNEQYFAPLPEFGAVTSIGSNADFDLEENYTEGGVTSGNGVSAVYDAVNEATNVKKRKFILGFQGGFDGQSPSIPLNVGSDITAGNTQGLDCTTISSPGSIAYKQCIGALSNADEWDVNLIVTPGLFSSLHSYVVNLTVEMCENRGDCFYVFDNVVFPESNQSVDLISAAVNEAATFDTSYAATYYPWVKIKDTNLNQIVSVPPSVIMPAVYAANDAVAAEWYAPAGLNRGGITQAVQVLDRTTHSDRDTLYEGRVNPIAAFPGTGIAVWGQKTLQVKSSALDRVNVRRLLINLKKFVASSSKYLLFEQNVDATRKRFLSIVNPYLENVQQRSGLYAFQVVCDTSNNTNALIDQNVLMGNIYIQPAKSIEFIVIPFTITSTGASFTE